MSCHSYARTLMDETGSCAGGRCRGLFQERVLESRRLPSSVAVRAPPSPREREKGEVPMLEGLPPNNATHRLTLVTDERRARAVADFIVESFEPAEAASTAFETENPRPGGGRAWLVEAYFGFAPDEDEVRALIAVAADEGTAQAAAFGVTEKRDWVSNSLAGLQPVRAGRFLVHGSHDRAKVGASDVAIEI